MRQAKLWWFLHVPQLLLDEQLSLQSQEQQQRPQVLCTSDGQRRRQVVQANRAAVAGGVRVGMAEVTASTLLPDLQQRDYDEDREVQVLRRLAQWLHQDIAQIALYPPHGLLLAVHDLQRMYGGYVGVQRQLQRRLHCIAVEYVVAAGYSPLVAQLLAQSGKNILSADKAVLQHELGQVSIAQSLLPAQQQQQLQEVGIERLGALLHLPVAELGARFGRNMLSYMAQLKGELLPPQQWYHPPLRFRECLDLLTEVASWQQLLFPLRRLLQQLEAFLQVRQLSVTELALIAHHRDKRQTFVRVAFALPLWRQRDMLQLVQLQLERQQLKTPALELSLRAEDFSAREVQHGSCLPAQQDAHTQRNEQRQLQALLGKLQARLGEQAVQQAQWVQDWRPELAQQWQTSAAAQMKTAISAHLPRPLWLLPEAEPINVSDWQLQWGPERIQSGWWDGQSMVRDYFIALDRWQRQGWIYRTCVSYQSNESSEQWYLHGWYS
ncbi:Y-family DNA polymerase [Pseudidiomarina homiensis]|uniref:Y-family DNA polymerase n=1 Tax=Pseudidiomarina homiensis TaxID=364198 RepID=UPI00215ADC4E|nr:DNA polymerase Y family protein [Pseudidiomarina homiensis]